jgi:hypothetical protein
MANRITQRLVPKDTRTVGDYNTSGLKAYLQILFLSCCKWTSQGSSTET